MSNLQQRKKIIAVPIGKGVGEKTKKGTLIVQGYFTSDQVDEVGDVITRAATEKAIPKYRQWGNIRRMHLPEPVAKVIRIGADDGLEWNQVEIEVIDPRAIFEVENGLLAALSVGILVDPKHLEPIDRNNPFGGFIIHEYTLSEISLVDHPANYDAMLTRNLPIDDTLRLVVRQYGLDAVAGRMAKFLEVDMEDENTEFQKDMEEEEMVDSQPGDAAEADAKTEKATPPCREAGEGEEDCIDRKVSEILAENPDMDRDQAAQIASEMCMSECPEDDPEAEDVGTNTDVSAGSEPEEEKGQEAEDQPEPDVMEELRQVVDSLHSLVVEFEQALKDLKAPAEAPDAEEQPVGEDFSAEPTEEKGADATEPEEPGVPANRKALFPGAGEDGKQDDPEQSVTDLRQALTRYLSRK